MLLLEAGGRDWHPVIHIPLGVGQIRQAEMFDWGYVSEPQPHLNDRRIELKRGKVLGGSSSINFMAHNRGNRSDYERWVRLGIAQWSYDHLLPYFKRLETWQEGARRRTEAITGRSASPTRASAIPLGWAVLEAAKAAGYSNNEDVNAAEPNGFGLVAIRHRSRATSECGQRVPASAPRAFESHRQDAIARNESPLREARRPSDCNTSASGRLREVRARREVILTSGAFNSPQLLMLSGIGDADALKKLGIAPLQHLPGVGANLQDHLSMPLTHRRIGEESPLHRMLRVDRVVIALANAYFAGKGPATVLPSGVIADPAHEAASRSPRHSNHVRRRGTRSPTLDTGIQRLAGRVLPASRGRASEQPWSRVARFE